MAAAITALISCAQACVSCTDACLGEDEASHFRTCIRRNQDCADLCRVTADALLRQTEPNDQLIQQLLMTCRIACNACATECTQHDHHAHCRICAETCREAERPLTDLLDAKSRPEKQEN
ncbi:four-helix bundle copper-binding protein [Arthrobacter sp. Soc17.1.1.1]|uniref:four-helix bundle copper-binding protein n=1 Tax=Arthrobacter sp. Soc17.1.1.1 TaxID=3121277 RepID=UPI002FE4ECD5